MITRLKVTCRKVAQDANGHQAEFSAVYGDNPENKAFFKYTPCASLTLTTTREQLFVVDKNYFIDISLADVEAAPPVEAPVPQPEPELALTSDVVEAAS